MLAEDEQWRPGSVAVALGRPAVWADPSRTIEVITPLLQMVAARASNFMPAWGYWLDRGTAYAHVGNSRSAHAAVSYVLATVAYTSGAVGPAAAALVAACRRALRDAGYTTTGARDPVATAARLMYRAMSDSCRRKPPDHTSWVSPRISVPTIRPLSAGSSSWMHRMQPIWNSGPRSCVHTAPRFGGRSTPRPHSAHPRHSVRYLSQLRRPCRSILCNANKTRTTIEAATAERLVTILAERSTALASCSHRVRIRPGGPGIKEGSGCPFSSKALVSWTSR